MGLPAFYPEGSKVLPSDDSNRTLHKIAALLGGSGSGGGSGVGFRQVYRDRYPASPDNTAIPAIDYNSGDQVIRQWDIPTLSWI